MLGALLSALAAAPAAHASPAEIVDLINRLRAGPGRCNGPPGLREFARRPELDRAAAMLAGGASLQDSAWATGYQSVTIKTIRMSGSTDPRALETLLARNYCPMIADPGLAEIGAYQHGTSTSVVLAAAFAPSAGLDEAGIATHVLALVNRARAQGRECGSTFYPPAGPVRWNAVLARIAKEHAEDMARNNYFAHNSLDGTAPADRVERAGYDYRSTGENIAAGQMTPEAAVDSWIRSPAHCANLMGADYTEMGVAMATNRQSSNGVYWTQVFGSPRAARPARADRPAGR